ncbi:TnsA endonuclease N-terminal domain-containing protein [Pseudoalteromonas sp. NJ631]|uniref:TnsA endonuclease N-terminal domain-containing protein n=1 Tax=Pseudoalteromonas sp. NJ631 TaxID=493915 RepID=UPI001E50C1C1|nr:TnsA endonuclease N-terminal domain-containing protein [Pseudoalteromonas sp. NJ631]
MCLVESSLEYDACFYLEYSPKIKHFEAQPLHFMYTFEGKTTKYTPDFLLTNTSNKQQLIEIKPKYETVKPDFITRFAQKRKTAREEHGIDLVLVTEAQICVEPMLDNFKLLHQYAGYQALTELQHTILNLLSQYNRLSVNELILLLKVTSGDTFSSVCRLLSLGKINSDLSSKLCLDSLVWRDE